MGCPPTLQVARPTVWYLVKLQRLLLNLDSSSTDWDLQFDNKGQICSACLPYVRFQESSFRPVFDCRPISIGKLSEGLVIEVYLESTKCLPRLVLFGDDGKPSFPVEKANTLMSNSSLVTFTPLFQCGWPP